MNMMTIKDMKSTRMNGFFCALWVQERAKELLYFAVQETFYFKENAA